MEKNRIGRMERVSVPVGSGVAAPDGIAVLPGKRVSGGTIARWMSRFPDRNAIRLCRDV